MKLTVLTWLFICATLSAQQSAPISQPPVLPALTANFIQQSPQGITNTFQENYALVLTISENKATVTEIELIVASPSFQATVGENRLSFSGSISIADADSAVVTFQLGWQTPLASGKDSTQLVPSNMQGSVRLKMGDEVQLMRAGSRSARLSIKRLEPRKAN